MSWDIFVQDIPNDAASVDDIPADFRPRPVAPRAAVVEALRRAAPFVDASDPTWLRIDGHGCDIEVSLGETDPVEHFAFHVHGGDASVGVIAAVLAHLRLRAFDPGSETGLFDANAASASLAKWLAYRDAVLAPPASTHDARCSE